MTRVFLSRHQPDLRPGQGDLIDWEIGEVVAVISGIDNGRTFRVTSEGMSHPGVSGLVREGELLGDPQPGDPPGGRCCKPEQSLWFAEGAGDPPNRNHEN